MDKELAENFVAEYVKLCKKYSLRLRQFDCCCGCREKLEVITVREKYEGKEIDLGVE